MTTNVLEWLEASARRAPGDVAFADEHGELSFEQLAQRARSAGSFIAARVEPCMPVAFYLEKSTAAVCGMMGAVYARCCYSVIDVRQPAARVESILQTLRPGLVVADERNFEQAVELFAPVGMEPVRLEDLLEAAVDGELLERRRAQALPDDPLYVNFTSGSTGTPKGVVVGHGTVVSFIEHFTELFGIDGDDVIANQAPFDFDVSVKDIYSGLLTGAAVHLVPREYFSVPVKLMDFLVERKVTVCTWAVSAMCFVSIMGGFDYKVPDTIEKVIFSGEVMPPKQLSAWQAALPGATFVNVYGPTEVTCNCTYHVVEREFAADEVVPMGRAFPDEKVFLLDAHDHEVVEPGVEGEVCVGGCALALGYYGDPERTAESFVQNPLHDRYADPVYRTGDLAMYDTAGELVYTSRKDHQVKHMGQRIELGEIEAAAQGVDGVTRACCLYDARKKKLLLFYLGDVETAELADLLHGKLPGYMCPNKLFALDEMPLNKNGKIDRDALVELARARRRRRG